MMRRIEAYIWDFLNNFEICSLKNKRIPIISNVISARSSGNDFTSSLGWSGLGSIKDIIRDTIKNKANPFIHFFPILSILKVTFIRLIEW